MTTNKTILIDADIILRMLVNDVPSQAVKAQKLFQQIERGRVTGIVTLLVIGEIVWVFENFYEKPRTEFIPNIVSVLSIKNIKILEIKKQDLIAILKYMLEFKLDFTHIYVVYFSKQLNSHVASFDKDLLKAMGK